MSGFLKRLGFILFWQMIIWLFLLIISPFYYIVWLIFSLVYLFFIVYLAFQVIPGRKMENQLRKLLIEYKKKIEENQEAKTKAAMRPFTCPACQHETHFLEFLENRKCPKCESKIWSTVIGQKEKEYYELYKFFEDYSNFISHLSFRQRSRLKKMYFMETAEKEGQ